MLRVAQPNLSTAIKQLEAEWGVTLFERAGRGLTVTDTGRALYERAAELLSGASALDQEMRAIGRGFTARLRVGFTLVSTEIITAMVARCRRRRRWIEYHKLLRYFAADWDLCDRHEVGLLRFPGRPKGSRRDDR